MLNYSTYASHDLIFDAMGFGHTPEDTTPLLTNTEYAASAWIGSATVLAQSLGLGDPIRGGVPRSRDHSAGVDGGRG